MNETDGNVWKTNINHEVGKMFVKYVEKHNRKDRHTFNPLLMPNNWIAVNLNISTNREYFMLIFQLDLKVIEHHRRNKKMCVAKG